MNRSSLIGFLLFSSFIIQFTSGILLSFYYNDFYNIAFYSVSHIIMDVRIGWFMRVLHIIGASLFMFFLLFHAVRGYYRVVSINNGLSIISYSIGLIILFLSLITGFLGYILNWGQMSFWGMIVIISILNSIPIIGDYIAIIIWPSYVLGIARLFTIHFLIGFLLLFIILNHIILLHAYSSSNPLINNSCSILLPFYCYFFKDVLYISLLIFIISFFLFREPDLLGNCDNNIQADPFTTPHNILPEWYFLLFYAVLRSYPSKIIGVLIVLLIFLVLVLFHHKNIINNNYWSKDFNTIIQDNINNIKWTTV